MAERKVKAWITLKGGKHIPIFEGESKENVKNRLKEGAKKGKEHQAITAKEEFVVGNNPPTEKEQAWMNAKAIKISKHLPKEKQAELRKQKREYEKQYKNNGKTWQDKDAEVKAKQMAEADVQKEERSEKYKRPMTEQHRNPSITADADSFKDKPPDSMQGKNHQELRNKLKSELGLVVDEEFEGKVNDGAQVVMYKKEWDGSIKERYVGTYHWLPNGEKQITDIKFEPELKEVKFGKNKYKVDKNGYTAIEKPKTDKPVNVAKVFNTALGSPDKQTVKDTIQKLTQLQEKDPSVTPYINQLQEHLKYLSRHDYKGGDV